MPKILTNWDFKKNQLISARIEQLATAPSNPVEGLIYYNTTDHCFYIYNGTGWVNHTTLDSARISDFAEAAQDAVGGVLADTDTIDFTYTNETGAITADVKDDSITAAKLNSDVAGAGLAQNVTTGALEVSAVDADTVTVSNLEVDNFKASAVVLEAEGIASNYNDTTIPTSAAVKDYVDGAISSANHTQNTDTGTTSSTFQLDNDASGVQIKNNSGVLEVRNAADSDFADIKVQNLTVMGTTTTVNSTDLSITDNMIVINKDETGVGVTAPAGAGIEIERGDLTNARIVWDESNDVFKAGIIGSETAISLAGHGHTSSDLSDFAEATQDVVGTMATDSTTIDFTYDDEANTLTAGIVSGSVGTTEIANDAVDKTKIASDVAGAGLGQNEDGSLEVNVGDGLQIVEDVVSVKLDGTSLANGTNGLKVSAIDASTVTVSNLDTGDFASGVIVTTIGATPADTEIPTAQAVDEFVGGVVDNLASTDENKGAALIGIYDPEVGGVFTATTVQGALVELEGRIDTLEVGGGAEVANTHSRESDSVNNFFTATGETPYTSLEDRLIAIETVVDTVGFDLDTLEAGLADTTDSSSGADMIGITDLGTDYNATTVQGALEEIVGDISTLDGLVDTTITGAGLGVDGTYTANATANYIASSTSLVDADNDLDAAIKAGKDDLASTDTGKGAALVGIADAGTYTDATTVEGALQDLYAKVTAPTKYATNIGDGVSTSIVVTHNLNDTDVIVQIKEVATSDVVLADVNITGVNTVTITFAVAPTTGEYRVVVMK